MASPAACRVGHAAISNECSSRAFHTARKVRARAIPRFGILSAWLRRANTIYGHDKNGMRFDYSLYTDKYRHWHYRQAYSTRQQFG